MGSVGCSDCILHRRFRRLTSGEPQCRGPDRTGSIAKSTRTGNEVIEASLKHGETSRSQRPSRVATTGMLVGTMILWSLCYPLIRVGLDYSPPFHFAALRAALAGAALCLLAASRRRPFPFRARLWLWLAVAGLGATTTGFYGMFFGGSRVSPGIATVVANTQPLIAAVLAFVVLRERLGRIQWLGLFVGFAGIATIAAPALGTDQASSSLAGYVYVLLAAGGVAVGNLAIKRVAGEVDAFVGMGVQLLIGAIPLFVLAGLLERPSVDMAAPTFIGVLVVISLAGTSLAFVLWCTALRYVQLSRANAFSFLTPLFAIAIGYFFYGERLDWNDAAGGALILGGLWCVTRVGQALTTKQSNRQSAHRSRSGGGS